MRLPLLLCLLPLPAFAEAPRVVTDIPPVHGLVSMVMKDVAAPGLILDKPGSAHEMALRPSQARQIADADLVIWIGEALSPALGRSLGSLAPNAMQLELMELEATHVLAYREAEDMGDDHAHDEHDDHAEHDDHGKHDEHHHGDTDPHVWLDPENAQIWLAQIAETLASMDAANAESYRLNAKRGQDAIATATQTAMANLEGITDLHFVVAHDGYQYFEKAFGLNVIGAVSDSHAREAGPAQLDALRERIAKTPPDCIIADPAAQLKRLAVVSGQPLPPVAELDPLGMNIAFGPDHYTTHLAAMAEALNACTAQ